MNICEAFAPSTLADWGLVIVGLGGVIVAWRTLNTLIEQSGDTGRAARAAEDSAIALKNSDRAWLLVNNISHQCEASGDYASVACANYGKTPASNVTHEMRFSVESPNPNPTDTSVFGDPHLPPGIVSTPQGQVWIGAGWLQPKGSRLTSLQWEDIQNGRLFLWAYGVVKYKDVYDREHKTTFCYRYISEGPHAHWCIDGSPEYNKAA